MPEVHVVGELSTCSGFLPPFLTLSGRALSSLSCNWQVDTPDDRHWRHIEGDIAGKTWLAQRTAPDETAAWHQPLDFTFAFSSAAGWPILLLTVMETDAHDRQDLGGYGVLRLPMSPGEHVRHVTISRPYGTLGQHITAYFVGGRPRYEHPVAALCTTDSRYGHRTVSMGVVEVRLSVALQGMASPEMAHVRFHTDRSQQALEQESVCAGCPPSERKATAGDDDEDADDEDDKPADRQALLRKEQ